MPTHAAASYGGDDAARCLEGPIGRHELRFVGMYGNRPLFAPQADAQLFVWTDAAQRLREALERGQHTLVIGEPGAGKTSLLHMIERALRAEDPPTPVCTCRLPTPTTSARQ